MSPKTAELLVQEIAPRIHSMASCLTPIGSEDREELCQDAIVIAATLLMSTEARAKKVTPGNIAFYAIGHIRQGRRSTGQNKTDTMHAGTQIVGRSRLLSLEQPLDGASEGDEPSCLHDMLAAKTEDPASAATRRLDWQPLVAALNGPVREVLLCLVKGEDLTTLVPKLKRARSILQVDKAHLAALVKEHLGEDILVRVQDQPRWRDNLNANRQRAACRSERQRA